MKFHWFTTWRDWDCYHDCIDAYYHHVQVGVSWRTYFIGISWTVFDNPVTPYDARNRGE